MKITKLIVIKTAYFLSQLSVRAKIFKDNKGFGTWGVDFRFKANAEISLLKLITKSVE